MRGDGPRGVLKVWLYAIASVLLGSWMAPLTYNAGKALAEVSVVKQTNGPLEWLADVCRRTEFPDFFAFTLLLAATILFLPFLEWLRGGNEGVNHAPWPRRKSMATRQSENGQALVKNQNGFRQLATGFVCVALLFSLFAGALHIAGMFSLKAAGGDLPRTIATSLLLAFAISLLMEFLFRGIALGVFLRAMPAPTAIGLSAVLFTLVLSLAPPEGMNVPDPDASGVGFEMLGLITGRLTDPRAAISQFPPLLALGWVLAYARWRTASLCLPVGIHAGWIFTDLLLEKLTVPAKAADTFLWMASSSPFMQGAVPLIAIILAGILTHHLTVSHEADGRSA